jgi:hypothetical protein
MILAFAWPLLAIIFNPLHPIHAESSSDRLCLPALFNEAATNLTIFHERNGRKEERIPDDIVAAHPGFSFPSSSPIVEDSQDVPISTAIEADFFAHRSKRRALDLKTKEMKERPTCRKNAGAYGQDDRNPNNGLGMKVAPKLANTQVSSPSEQCKCQSHHLLNNHIVRLCTRQLRGSGTGSW